MAWYAVQRNSEDDWSYGSHSLHEAASMLSEQGYGLIAVVNEETNTCITEISYEDAFVYAGCPVNVKEY